MEKQMQLTINVLAKYGVGIFIGLTLLLAQACSQQVKSEKNISIYVYYRREFS
jgi:hypothetical protein